MLVSRASAGQRNKISTVYFCQPLGAAEYRARSSSKRANAPTPPTPPHQLHHPGTEPKLKYYLEVKGSDAAAAAALADRLVGGLAEELVGLSRHGLKRPATPH